MFCHFLLLSLYHYSINIKSSHNCFVVLVAAGCRALPARAGLRVGLGLCRREPLRVRRDQPQLPHGLPEVILFPSEQAHGSDLKFAFQKQLVTHFHY